MKFALIGTGRIGKMHAEIIKTNPLSELISLTDINVEEAKKVGYSLNVKVTSTEDIFNDPNKTPVISALNITTHLGGIFDSTASGAL